MAIKNKATLLAQLTDEFDMNLADEIIKQCKAGKGKPLDPYEEFIHPGRIRSQSVLGAWTSDEAREYIETRMAAKVATGNPLLSTNDSECAPAAVALLSQHFMSTPENGQTTYRVEDAANRIVTPAVPMHMEEQVSHALKPTLRAAGIAASRKLSNRLYDLYSHNCELQEPPKLWAQPDDDCWCLGRAIVQPDASIAWDHFRTFVERLNDPEAFGAWYWGIYSGRYKGRQMLYISDTTGEGGKSSAFRALEGLFNVTQDADGNLIYPKVPRITAALNWNILKDSSHASSSFVGKRFVWVGDCKNPSIFHTQVAKELSGDDMSMVNPKHQPAFSTYFEASFAVLSNMEPNISSERHNRTRTLWLKLSPLNVPADQITAEWANHYQAEMPGFLAWAEQCYEERCDNDTKIRVNCLVEAATELRVCDYEASLNLPLQEHFVLDEDAILPQAVIERWFKEQKFDAFKATDFKDNMERTYGLEKIAGGPGGGWYYRGIRLKASGELWRSASDTTMVAGDGFAIPAFEAPKGNSFKGGR